MEEEKKGDERNADEEGKHGNDYVVVDADDLWVKLMKAKLASCPPSHPFTICRVPTVVRRVDNDAYDPLMVSIGPYHRGKSSLHYMEEVKWRNLKKFHDGAGNDFNKYWKAMKEIEPQARACYSGDIKLEPNEFIEMMLLDGLFIIQLLLNRANSFLFQLLRFHSDDEDPIYTIRGMLRRVGHDMLLLENQLPFFVLERLWDLTGQRRRFVLWKRAIIFIRDFAMPFGHEWNINILTNIFAEEIRKKREKEKPELNVRGFHHLLHLVYSFLKPTSLIRESQSVAKLPAVKKKTLPFLPSRCHCLPSPSGQESESPSGQESESPSGQESEFVDCNAKLSAVVKKILPFLPPRCHCFPSPSGQKSESMECTRKLPAVIEKMKTHGLPFLSSCKSRNEPPALKVIPCAAELHEAGVKFQCVKAKSFLDIKFEQGTLKMPRLSVQDPTKSLFRNFIAFEQCFPNRGSHFTSYCNFMDYLVNTPRDVEILKKSAIIENCLGNDEEVARLFNDLCKEIALSGLRSSYLAESFEQVIKHTQRIWPKWQVKLKQEYFSSPWSIISFLAATFVIILTTVQTYYTVFT